jgi:hypothetical protein
MEAPMERATEIGFFFLYGHKGISIRNSAPTCTNKILTQMEFIERQRSSAEMRQQREVGF